MRKMITTAFVITLFSCQSFGQISIGIKAGLNLSEAKNIGSADNQAKVGLNGGLLTEIRVSRKFIVQPELLYSLKGFKFPATTFNGSGTVSLDYVSIPLLGGYRPCDKFTILLGPEFDFLTSANSGFRKFDLAIDVGATYNIKNDFGIELRYSYGFEDLADVILTDQSGNEIGKDRIGSNRVFQLGLFYKFSKK